VSDDTFRPRLFVWDEEKQDWLEAGRVCVARWRRSGGGHKAGDICGRDATDQIGDVDLCGHHYDVASAWRADTPNRGRRKQVEFHRQWESEQAERDEEHQRQIEERRRNLGVIYYIRRASDGLIKIGTTGSLSKRLATHRREHGEIQLLLTHSGGRGREAGLHAEFRDWQYRGEWFHPGWPLMQHIDYLRRSLGIRSTQAPGTLSVAEVRKLRTGAPRVPPPGRYVLPKRLRDQQAS
jgi:hypothetical protein